MHIGQISELTFKYKHLLKTQWLKGNLPSVTRGLYGDTLTRANVSLEHLRPHSKGGHTVLANLALASKARNNARGCQPLRKFLTQSQADEYLSQFRGINIEGFNGDSYIRRVGETIKGLLK